MHSYIFDCPTSNSIRQANLQPIRKLALGSQLRPSYFPCPPTPPRGQPFCFSMAYLPPHQLVGTRTCNHQGCIGLRFQSNVFFYHLSYHVDMKQVQDEEWHSMGRKCVFPWQKSLLDPGHHDGLIHPCFLLHGIEAHFRACFNFVSCDPAIWWALEHNGWGQ